jgi:hypothetical protein
MATSTRLCRLHEALGRDEACPEEPCPFWEPGGAVVEARCAFERLDLSGRPDFARWLLGIRRKLDSLGRSRR